MSAKEEETPPVEAAAADKEGGANENGAEEANADGNNRKNGRRDNDRRRDETPIEELFDLSKPIPKVDKPDKDAHDNALKELTDEVETLKKQRAEVQAKIDEAMSDPDSKATLTAARSKFNELKAQKNSLIEEKKVLRSQLDGIQNQREKLIKDKKNARSSIRFDSIEKIDEEIAKLERKQETTSMSLSEEKKLIKEIDALKASKKLVSSMQDKDADLDNVQQQKKNISDQIKAKDVEINAINAQMDETMEKIKEVNDKETKKRDAIQELFKERDDIKDKMKDKLKEKDLIRDEFRTKNNAFYNFQRAVRAQKKMQYEEEKRKRDEEKAAYLAALEAEEAKKIPYEEEQALCDYLADYLERTYLGKAGEKKEEKEEKVAAKDDAFAGLTPIKKADDEEYFGKGKGKKKRVRQAKKQDSVAAPFNLSVDLFEQFGFLNLSPPTAIDQVEQSVKELRAKKLWYKEQPRGSVPTAAEIRKQREKEAAKVRQGAAQPSNGAAAAAGGAKFSLSKDDFAPLSASAKASGAGANASWGQQPAAAPASTEATEKAAEGAL